MRHARLLQGLTPQQREAVLHTEGPLLILAGAGSGKTRTVTRRIARLIADGAKAESILAITFTNKAAGEMRERVSSLIGARVAARPSKGKGPSGPQISTFHAFAVRLLRQYGQVIGWSPRFSIMDPGEQLGLVREAAVAARVDLKRYRTQDLAHGIGRAKEQLDDAGFVARATSDVDRAAAAVLPVYRKLQRMRGGMDFEDLVAESVRLLETHDETRAAVRERLRFVLIDEYQDTNHSQYRLAQALTGERRNLAVCGDPDQSIYGWRGADMRNILRFEEEYPGCKVILLEQNYRSTATILRASNHLIGHNLERKEKQLLPTGAEGEKIEVVACLDAEREADYVARAVDAALDEGVPASEIAVVFRGSVHARSYEDALVQRQVPCAMAGGTSFFERAAVKDALSWVRLALNVKDDLAALRALRGVSGIGKRTLDKLHETQRSQGISLLEACQRPEQVEGVTEPTRDRLRAFAARIGRLTERAEQGIEELVAGAMDELPELPEARAEEAQGREGDLRRLLEAARAADAQTRGKTAQKRARNFLDKLSLLDARDKGPKHGEERVTLTTVHASKGLEFAIVFCVGMEESLFPHHRALAEGGVEEERRLAYVAFTRAKDRLVLTYATQRSGRFGGDRRPSRFLYELPPELLWDPILRETMVLPELDTDAPEARRWSKKGGKAAAAPSTPRLLERGLKRRGKATAAIEGGKKQPRWARGLVRKGKP